MGAISLVLDARKGIPLDVQAIGVDEAMPPRVQPQRVEATVM